MAIGVVYVIVPPTWEDLTHLAISGLVDSSNEVWREGTDLVSVARELGQYWGHTFYVRCGGVLYSTPSSVFFPPSRLPRAKRAKQ